MCLNGTSYSPGWRRAYNTKNKPTAADVGALPLSGGALTGGLTAAGEIFPNRRMVFVLPMATMDSLSETMVQAHTSC